MMKYTKGPWGISMHHEKGTKWPAHYMIGQRDEMYDHAIVLSAKDEGEGKANAHLIAAAPEMYEALKLAQQFITNGRELGYISMPDADTGDTALETPDIIRKALAKAEGGQ